MPFKARGSSSYASPCIYSVCLCVWSVDRSSDWLWRLGV